MPEINLRIYDTGFKQFAEHVSGLAKGDLKNIHRHAAWTFAKHVRGKIEEAYETADYPLRRSAVDRYTSPPKQGSRTADARKYTGTRPLERSGLMSRSVVVRRRADSYFVQIDPAKVYPDGKRVAFIAERLEQGWNFTVRMTKATLAYLHASKPELKGSRRIKLGDTVVIRQKPRPIWEQTFKKLRSWKHVYHQVITRWLEQHGNNPSSMQLK